MKPFWLLTVLLSVLLLVHIPFPRNNRFKQAEAIQQILAKKQTAIACAPDRTLGTYDNPLSMIALPGWGNYRWPTQTGSDSASFYFNQGINLYYSFHLVEAMASFQKSAALAPDHPLAYWGIALAYGPNINDVSYRTTPLALEAARNAAALSAKANPFEQGLISAMLLRYSNDPAQSRASLDQQYADAMLKVYQQFPDQPDAGALYADALMLLHPWDLYGPDQAPKPWTPELVGVLETVLRKAPMHPGANHYYIHTVEASTEPGRAMASAERLGNLLPMVSHMVHMPSHIYIRTGHYEKGIEVNKQAVAGYRKYLALMPQTESGSFLYLLHNLHMQATNAMNNGQYREAKLAASALQSSIPLEYLSGAPPEAEYLQYMYMTSLFTEVRFGKWDSVLRVPALPDSLVYARLLREFGRSLAFSRLGKFADARSAITQMERIMATEERLRQRMGAFNSAYEGAAVAVALATGILAESEKQWPEAISQLQRATQLEDRMVYNEPKDWLLPPREYLGAALWKAGQHAGALEAFNADLAFNPGNGWSLFGRALVLKSTQDPGFPEALKAAEKVRKQKDFSPSGPVF